MPPWLKTYGWLKYDEEKNFGCFAVSLTENILWLKLKNVESTSIQLWRGLMEF